MNQSQELISSERSLKPQQFTTPVRDKNSIEDPNICSFSNDFNQDDVYFNKDRNIQKRVRVGSARKLVPPVKRNETKIESDALKILRALRIKNMVKYFIEALLMKSYIVSNALRKQLYTHIEYRELNKIHQNYKSEQQFPTFSPSNKFLIYWDFVGIILNLIILWLSPFFLSFGYFNIGILHYLMIGYQVWEIIINANRAIIEQGTMIYDRKEIIKNYLRYNFKYDIVSLVFWGAQSSFATVILEISLILVCMSAYMKINYYISFHFESLYLRENISQLISLGSLILHIYYYAHFTGCVFHYVGEHTSYLGTSCIIKLELSDSDIWMKYNYSFYWATMTMTTVGYGDILAQNYIELISSSIIMFISCCVFAYSMNSIGMILKSLQDSHLKYNLILMQINQFMSKNHVEQNIQQRVRNYLKYLTKQNNGSQENVNQIIDLLPDILKTDLLDNIQTRIINSMKFITANYSPSTQKKLSKCMETMTYTPGDTIFLANQNNESLYFIKDGSVEIYEINSKQPLQTLQKGKSFGIEQFFTGQSPRVCAKSKGFCEIYTIHRKRFLSILIGNQKDFETFHMMKDSISLNSNYSVIDEKCHFCSKFNHSTIDCSMLSYKPDLELLIKRANLDSTVNERKEFCRFSGDLKFNSLAQQQFVENEVQQYQKFQEQLKHQEQQKQGNESVYSLPETTDPENNVKQTSIKRIKYKDQIAQINATVSFSKIQKLSDNQILYNKVQHCLSFNLDSVKSYKHYFPHNNIKSVINKFENAVKNNYYEMLQFFTKYSFNYRCQLFSYNYRLNHS